MYYSQTAAYWLKFYFSNLSISKDEINKSRAKDNWSICQKITRHRNENDLDFLKAFYTADDSKSYIVKAFADEFNINESSLWKKVKDIEKEYAEAKRI